MWHMRVLKPFFRFRLNVLLKGRGNGLEWWTSASPVGRSVFPTPDGSDKGAQAVLKCWASPDDCDFIGHLSNSSYTTNLDPIRMKAFVEWFPRFFAEGGWAALGGAHYHYIREIPLNASYEIRISVGGWEDKWIYFVAKFVTRPKQKSKASRKAHHTPSTVPTITTPSTPLTTEPPTPAELGSLTSTSHPPLNASSVDSKLASGAVSKPALRTHDDDGALIHCIAVSTICFKHGRVTVPPKIVLAMSGYSLHAVGDVSNWSNANRVRGRGSSRVSEFYRGGWKNEKNKFWESGPQIEAERAKRVADLRKLTEGLDGLRAY